jgi:hypothetical protein
VDLHGIEETFHDDDASFPGEPSAVEIEENLGFPESSGKTIFRFGRVYRPPGIRDKFPHFIANRYHYSAMEDSGAAIESDAKGPSRVTRNETGA